MRSLAVTLLAALAVGCSQHTDSSLDGIVAQYASQGRFMGTVLVARGDEVLLRKGYGFADLEENIPNAPSTKFRLGSLTKQFTAASILLLQERGKLTVEDRVRKYVPEAPQSWENISLVHLLTHTSGIADFTGFAEYSTLKIHPSTPRKTMSWFRNRPLEFSAGERWSYSNSGYVVLGLVIENITGATYEQFVQDNIFRSLGMIDSSYDLTTTLMPHHAVGYVPGPSGPVPADFIDMSVPYSAGGLLSTVEDLWRWERALFGGRLLSAESLKRMTTPFKNGYAFGLLVDSRSNRTVVAHAGEIEGFDTYLAYYAKTGTTIAVLSNLSSSNAAQIGLGLGDLIHHGEVSMRTH